MSNRLTVDASGRLRGNAKIEYNDPFPTPNGSWGSGAINGVIMHTMVGNLPGTIALFNDPTKQVSAHFGIDQQGTIHQFGPIGKGWIAWAEVSGNDFWYSIEHADNGNPNEPLTPAQLLASAQVVECLSAFAGFPLQVTDSVNGKGYGTHSMGGAAWGGHTCPDKPPRHVRSAQRADIILKAKAIRLGVRVLVKVTTDGTTSLRKVVAAQGDKIVPVLLRTFSRGVPQADLIRYLAKANFRAPLPKGIVLYLYEG